MNQKANEALIATILQRWTATSNPSAGTTAVASVAATPKVRHTLGIITASQKNQTAGAVTASLKVTADSIAGTVLAQQHFLTAAAGVERFGFEFALPAPSVRVADDYHDRIQRVILINHGGTCQTAKK